MTGAVEGAGYGVAMVGHSFMGRAHSHAWGAVSGFADVAPVRKQVLVGRDLGRASAAREKLGWAEVSTDFEAVLRRDDIQIVDICAPGHLHADYAIRALDAGKHVLVEKPLANTLAEAELMAAAARSAASRGVRSMVGFNYRSIPALAEARSLIEGGRLGEIRQIRVSYLQDWLVREDAPMTWRLRKETAGSGVLGDLASHAIDQIRFLTGDRVSSVSGTLKTFVTERPGPNGREQVTVDDAAWGVCTLVSGAIASVEVSRCATGAKNSLSIEVFGSRGALRFDLESLNELWFYDADLPEREQGFRRILVTEPEHPFLSNWWPTGHILGWESSFINQMGQFLQCVEGDRNPSPSFDDGLATQRVLDAIALSAQDHSRTVALTDPAAEHTIGTL
ncbi:Gfo/Idh/MocA family protein [Lysinibacter cavernae]|uniref:Putative dehydrogenase n=1 Tax=Lysinibacter cavernae TaxID=1640652 RepID=A0A7X5TUY1_9MICO|nr:Gfo/Idh/MocA family oxidoreductase [Lysinibacter cavernae]NIH54127.1 putative dehydrogenase [Lysinibacter cavernae]